MSNKIDSIKVSGVTYNIKDLNAARTITLTQEEYDALQTKDPNVFYIISDSSIDYVTSAETQSAITQAVSGKADSSSVYLKSETSGATEISTALDSKLDATAYTPTDLSNYYTTAQTDTKISQAVSGKANSSDVVTNLSDGKLVNQAIGVNITKNGSNTRHVVFVADSGLTATTGELTLPYVSVDFNTVAAKSDIAGKADTTAVTTVNNALTAHTADTTVHVTQSDKNTWNAKSDFSGSYNDLTDKPTIPTVPTSNTAFTNDAGYLVASDITGKADTTAVTTVNNSLTAHTANTTVHVTAQDKTNWNAKSDFSGDYNDLTNKPTIPTVPTSNTAFTNDAGYLVASDIAGKADTTAVTAVNDTLTAHTANTTVHVTQSDKTNWNAKSDFSGSYNDLTDKPTIPTVPTSNTAFTNDAGYITDSALDGYATETYVSAGLNTKQDTLESGVNIKTINNYSLVGSGNINIAGTGGNNVVELTQAEYDALDPKDPSAFYIITDAEGGDLANYMTSAQTQTAINQATSGKTNQSDFTGHTANTTVHITSAERTAWNAKSDFSGSYNDLTDKPTIPTVPTSNTAFTNDAGYLVASDIAGKADTTAVTSVNNALTAHTSDSTIHVTSSDKTTWSGKQDQLVSGTNIKTINNESILGSGNITIQGGGGVDTGTVQTMIDESISGKTNQSDFTGHTANTTVHVTAQDKTNWNAKSDFSGSYNDLTNKLSAGDGISISNQNVITTVTKFWCGTESEYNQISPKDNNTIYMIHS